MSSGTTSLVTDEDVAALAARVREQVPQVCDLTLILANQGQVVINLLRIDKDDRGQGHGTRALELITDWADQRDAILTLTPTPMHREGEKRTGKRRLRALYTRHGFRTNRSHPEYSESMVREPVASHP